MYTDAQLAAAVDAGALSAESAEAFRSYVAQAAPAAYAAAAESLPATHPDEENFRLVTGFNDIFVVIACALLLVSVAWIGSTAAPALGAAAAAAVAWGLAEYFVRRRHMALPGIVLLLAFVGGVLGAGLTLVLPISSITAALASAIAAVAAWLHWRRFRVPITVAAGAAAMVAALVAVIVAVMPDAKGWVNALTFAAGVLVFVLAMRWDMRDPRRETRLSDVAFWLHLLAAPLLVRPIFALLHVSDGTSSLAQAGVVIVIYIVLGLVSLAIDRRALMVSALAYVLYTFTALLGHYGVVSLGFAFAACVIGSGLLLLSAFWHRVRARVLRLVPPTLAARLPDAR